MILPPQRSPFGVYYRSTLGVRGTYVAREPVTLYAVHDARIVHYSPYHSSTLFNWGTSTDLRITVKNEGSSAWYLGRALLAFDIASLGISHATSAVLRLYVTGRGGASVGFDAAIVLKDWGEGSKAGSTATSGECCGPYAKYTTSAWASPPCDDPTDRTAFGLPAYVTAFGWVELDVLGIVNAWLAGTYPNYGLLVALYNESVPVVEGGARYLYFSSREGTYTPELVVT